MMRHMFPRLALLSCLLGAGCEDPIVTPLRPEEVGSAPARDAALPADEGADAGTDAADRPPDAGAPDAGAPDIGSLDGELPDGEPADATPPDADARRGETPFDSATESDVTDARAPPDGGTRRG